jgi:hypothetical protein
MRQLHKNAFVTPGARSDLGKMTTDQKKTLDSIGFVFELPDDMKPPKPVEWEEAYQALVVFHKKNKNCNVPYTTVSALSGGRELKLAKWAMRQRQVYKNTFVTPQARKNFGQMTTEQRAKLEALSFDFEG